MKLEIASIAGDPVNPRGYARGRTGFTLIEMLVGMVISSIVLSGVYTLWLTNQEEGYRLGKKIELRNQMTLSSKRIQRSITLAGFGLGRAANLGKEDAVGSDTLKIFTNATEAKSLLLADITSGGPPYILVQTPSMFAGAAYVAVSSGSQGEIRAIVHQNGSTLQLDSPFSQAFSRTASMAFPATRERYYTDQDSNFLVREYNGGNMKVGRDVRNFQVSFRDSRGVSTDIASEIRTVQFSFTGVFPAREGALNSIVFSSTAIPRNTL